jgi:hypothetical protein
MRRRPGRTFATRTSEAPHLDELLQEGLVSSDRDFAVLGHTCAPTEDRPGNQITDENQYICANGTLVRVASNCAAAETD